MLLDRQIYSQGFIQLFLIPVLPAIFECAIAIVCDLAPMDTIGYLLLHGTSYIYQKHKTGKAPRVSHCRIAWKPVGPNQKTCGIRHFLLRDNLPLRQLRILRKKTFMQGFLGPRQIAPVCRPLWSKLLFKCRVTYIFSV